MDRRHHYRRLKLAAFTFACIAGYGNAIAARVPGTGLGAIPDGIGGTGGGDSVCNIGTSGPPLVISFPVTNIADVVSTVSLSLAFEPAHTYVGDLHVVLSAPGDAPNATIFGDTGANGTTDDSSNVAGPYYFVDDQPDDQPGDWWAAAATAADAAPIPAGAYRATTEGGATTVLLNSVFGGLPAERSNGLWTLSITDDCAGDTGTVSSAVLFVNDTLPVELQGFRID